MSAVSPLYPQEPTSSVRPATSEKCQQRTSRISTSTGRSRPFASLPHVLGYRSCLADNEPTLRVIAHELVTVIKGNVSVDWMHRDSARANIRRHVKRLLRKYGY